MSAQEHSADDPLDGAEWLRLDFTDMFGGMHALHLPATRFEDVVKHGTPFDGSAMEGLARSLEADMVLMPDESTLTRGGDGPARVVCTARTPTGDAWLCDPRVMLQGVLDRLNELASTTTVAAELEFYLLDHTGNAIDQAGYYDGEENAGIRTTRAAASQLARFNVAIDSCHAEAGPGQFELDLAPQMPLRLADALMLAKQVVQEAAAEIGVRASFHARPLDRAPGSGLHLHQRAGALLDRSGALTRDGESFVAGQLRHARALSALAAPTVNSYKRLHSGPEAPSAAVWARSNRGALVRVSSFREGEASIEYRGADPSANPYLLVAGLLIAGADGIAGELALPPPSDEDAFGGYDPAAATVRFSPLPRDLDDALDAFLADDVLVDAFDGHLISRLTDGLRSEAAEHRSRVTPWELGR
jgi:glutamine synthetase